MKFNIFTEILHRNRVKLLFL